MYVSAYDSVLREAFDNGVESLSETQEATIKKLVDHLQERVSDRLQDSMKDYLISNLKDDICREAARIAEKMIEDALGGDDAQIRNLFGFNDYGKRLYTTAYDHPREWKLIAAIVDKRPDIFANEKIEQQAAKIDALRKDLARQRSYCENYHVSKSDCE